jgi:mannose-6-phosphate isomerase-like protein (cupin superfamily)
MKTLVIGQAPDAPDAVAPDGIPIHLVLCGFHTAGQEAALGPMQLMSVAEGRIAPGQWGVHAHCSLEQVSYVLEGEVIVRTRDTIGDEVHSVRLTRGQAFVTLPTQTLSFANPGATVARVLFLCAPPYPADDSDTLLAFDGEHRPLTSSEIERAIAQQERMKEQMTRVFDERIAELRKTLKRTR